jgi:hypothetical protein
LLLEFSYDDVTVGQQGQACWFVSDVIGRPEFVQVQKPASAVGAPFILPPTTFSPST